MLLPRLQDLVEQDSATFAALIRTGDLDAAVPSCPGWTLTDLAVHLSGTQRWATQTVRTGERGEHPVGPRDRDGLERWFVEGARDLVTALRESDPEAPAWNFGPPPRIAAFWSRRMAHETAVHLWDAMASQGLDATIDPELAADGIDELASVFVPMRVRSGALPAFEQSLVLDPTDVRDASVRLAAGGDGDASGAVITLRAPAQVLLLVLWGRASLDQVEIAGEAALVGEVLALGLTP